MSRISKVEWAVAALVAAVLGVLVLLEPDIVEAPFENARTMAFSVGGTAVAAAALVLMLRFRVPPAIRIVVLVVPFVAVNWWLLSPFFIDDVVDDEFVTSIAEQQEVARPAADSEDPPVTSTSATVAEGPALIGAGSFVGLAGHEGTGDAGVFQNPDGTQVVRFERFDIENGPDLEVYVVPGVDQTTLADGSLHLGSLKGNVGDQTYDVPSGAELGPGEWTVLVWCEAFNVEFVGATVVLN